MSHKATTFFFFWIWATMLGFQKRRWKFEASSSKSSITSFSLNLSELEKSVVELWMRWKFLWTSKEDQDITGSWKFNFEERKTVTIKRWNPQRDEIWGFKINKPRSWEQKSHLSFGTSLYWFYLKRFAKQKWCDMILWDYIIINVSPGNLTCQFCVPQNEKTSTGENNFVFWKHLPKEYADALVVTTNKANVLSFFIEIRATKKIGQQKVN